MKRRILSIDFDYFIDTDNDTRLDKFPEGVDEKPKDELIKSWDYFYEKYPEIKDIGVIKSFDVVKSFLSNLRFGEVLTADSHSEIGSLFSKVKDAELLEVIHIDFHHDNYISGGSSLDCANWVRHLMTHRNENNTTILWCKREDSEVVSLTGEFPYLMTEKLDLEGEFDYIFLCFVSFFIPCI